MGGCLGTKSFDKDSSSVEENFSCGNDRSGLAAWFSMSGLGLVGSFILNGKRDRAARLSSKQERGFTSKGGMCLSDEGMLRIYSRAWLTQRGVSRCTSIVSREGVGDSSA